MNILIVSHGIPSKADPQWGCFELDQARALQARGHKISIVAIDGRFRHEKRRIGFRHTVFDGIDTCVYYLFPLRLIPFRRLRLWFRDHMMLRLFYHMVRYNGFPDIIYAHYFFTLSQLSLIRHRYPEIPVLGIEHAGRIIKNDVFSREYCIRMKRAYKNADTVLSVSPALRDALLNKFGVNSEVLFDMVGKEFLVEEINRKKHSPFKFVTTGSLVEDKAIDLILKALGRIEDQLSELFIVGDGPERDNLSALASSLGLSNRVHFLGMCNKRQIIELYQECDVFVLVSRLETFCVVNIEAMAMGLPVISTRCGGPEYYINKDNGILLEVDDLESLVAAMNTMELIIDKYDPQELREYVRSRFSGEMIAQQAESIMKKTIEQKKQLNKSSL